MNNIFTLQLNIDFINVILRQLDAGPHSQVRQVIDQILQQVQAQQVAAQQQAPADIHKEPEAAQ